MQINANRTRISTFVFLGNEMFLPIACLQGMIGIPVTDTIIKLSSLLKSEPGKNRTGRSGEGFVAPGKNLGRAFFD